MESKIIVTDDNSKTLLIPELNETYHSTKGALTEARHVFLKEGLEKIQKNEVAIFEMGFGTGLNALLTLDYSLKSKMKVNYLAIEAYPISIEKALDMDYLSLANLKKYKKEFNLMHSSNEKSKQELNDNFSFSKFISKFQDHPIQPASCDLVFHDAFGPKIQPELWNIDCCNKFFDLLKPGGILVTYCAQGAFKRNLKAAGFRIESIPGPPGKREMTRAIKE